jgi:hypothetical protein
MKIFSKSWFQRSLRLKKINMISQPTKALELLKRVFEGLMLYLEEVSKKGQWGVARSVLQQHKVYPNGWKSP